MTVPNAIVKIEMKVLSRIGLLWTSLYSTIVFILSEDRTETFEHVPPFSLVKDAGAGLEMEEDSQLSSSLSEMSPRPVPREQLVSGYSIECTVK